MLWCSVVWLALSSMMGSVSWICLLGDFTVFCKFSFIPLTISCWAADLLSSSSCQLCLLMWPVKGQTHMHVNSKTLTPVTSHFQSKLSILIMLAVWNTLKGPLWKCDHENKSVWFCLVISFHDRCSATPPTLWALDQREGSSTQLDTGASAGAEGCSV